MYFRWPAPKTQPAPTPKPQPPQPTQQPPKPEPAAPKPAPQPERKRPMSACELRPGSHAEIVWAVGMFHVGKHQGKASMGLVVGKKPGQSEPAKHQKKQVANKPLAGRTNIHPGASKQGCSTCQGPESGAPRLAARGRVEAGRGRVAGRCCEFGSWLLLAAL